MPEIPRVKTPLSEVGLALAVCEGHFRCFRQPPGANRLSVAWAQLALEHARGQAMYCFNVGNVTAGQAWRDAGKDFYVEPGIAERIQKNPDVWKKFDMRFRAYPVPAEGVEAYWRLLAAPRYASVLPLFDEGRAFDAAYRLGQLGYYTAIEDVYSKAVDKLATEFRTRILPHLPPWTEPAHPAICEEPDTEGSMCSLFGPDEVDQILGLVATSLDTIARDLFAPGGDYGPPRGDES